MSEPTVVPYSVPALPDGAGSPQEAVVKHIQKQNEQQVILNNTFIGGRRSSRRRQSSKRSSHKRSSYKSVKRGGKRRESSKRVKRECKRKSKRSSSKRSGHKRIVIYGGEPEEVSVPQFGNNSDPNGPNESSAKFNEILLASKQGGVHDKEI